MTDLTYGSLFSGVGGLDLAVEETFGARHGVVTRQASAAIRALMARINN